MGGAGPGRGAALSGEQLGALVAGAVLLFWVLGAYNRLVALRNGIGQAWTRVEQAQRQRGALVAPLVSALRQPLTAEHGALDALLAAQGRSAQATGSLAARPVDATAAGEWTAAEGALLAAASRLFALLEQRPDLLAQDPPAALVRDWREIEPRLAFARQLFSEAAASHDEALAQFPTRLLVRLFGFRPAGRL